MAVQLNTDGEMKRKLSPSSFRITEPNENDEVTGEKYMQGVIDEYQKYLAERTRHELGNLSAHNLRHRISFLIHCIVRVSEQCRLRVRDTFAASILLH